MSSRFSSGRPYTASSIAQLGRGVLHLVPFFEGGAVLQAEVRRQVDDLDAGRQQRRGLRHGDAMRGGEEDHVALRQVGLVRGREGQVHAAAQ